MSYQETDYNRKRDLADYEDKEREIARLKEDLARYDQKDIVKTREINILTKENNELYQRIVDFGDFLDNLITIPSVITTVKEEEKKMLPTAHLKLLRSADGTIKNVLQWWQKPGWTQVGDPDSGEWRDLPSETIAF